MKTFAFIVLAIFLVLYGLAAVTNVTIAMMAVITGLSALLAGVLIFILAARNGV